MHWQLTEDIVAKFIDKQDFEKAYKALAYDIFHDQPIFSPLEKEIQEDTKVKALLSHVKDHLNIYVGLYHKEALIGFHWGFQESLNYYMARTGLLPEYQNKGLYSTFLPGLLEHLKSLGFQSVYSKHIITHNQVIVPKLKSGFVLSKFELSEYFGVLVHLSYYFNPKRREMLDYRAGKRALESHLDDALEVPGP